MAGDNGTFDGQGAVWWEWFESGTLNYSRPHIIELVSSENILISNLTFLNAPSVNIHPVYCSHVHIRKVLIETTVDSPYVLGVVPGTKPFRHVLALGISGIGSVRVFRVSGSSGKGLEDPFTIWPIFGLVRFI